MVNKSQNLDAGEDSIAIGNIEGSIGNRSIIIGATDANGNTTLNHPMAVGHNASAGQNAIAIGTGAKAGIESNISAISSMNRPEQVEYLQNMLLARATGGDAEDREYCQLRRDLLQEEQIRELLPHFVTTCCNLSQFWSFIKTKFGTYQERREYIWEEFCLLMNTLESFGTAASPPDRDISAVLANFDEEHVSQAWQKALKRRHEDPEAAITSAKSLLESVCKHILEEASVPYGEQVDLPKLYKEAAKQLNMAPEQHQEQIFKQILGGCQSVVQGLGSMRNKLSDAHGKGKNTIKPNARHAALAVNLAGSMAAFMVVSWNEKKNG